MYVCVQVGYYLHTFVYYIFANTYICNTFLTLLLWNGQTHHSEIQINTHQSIVKCRADAPSYYILDLHVSTYWIPILTNGDWKEDKLLLDTDILLIALYMTEYRSRLSRSAVRPFPSSNIRNKVSKLCFIPRYTYYMYYLYVQVASWGRGSVQYSACSY